MSKLSNRHAGNSRNLHLPRLPRASDAKKPFQSPRRQILVIDDEPLLRQLINDYLNPLGYSVLQASTGEDGLELANRHPIHVIILDINLGDMTGFDVVAILKSRAHTRDIPVIAFTGLAQDQERRAILAAGFNHYVRKPIHLSKLAAIVSRAASKR
jgi:CheY-like chemotaxis protein